MAKPKLGSGARFRAVERSAAASGGNNPAAIAAAVGRAKLGNHRMAQLAAAGRKRAAHSGKDIDGGNFQVDEKPTVAVRLANENRSVADAIARKKVHGDVSRDLDETLDNGPNDSYVVRDTYGTVPAKET
jgi:hypothetical protein